MKTPTVDIIVPVWNRPTETRACLASILTHSPDARLIIIDNGCNRETQLMLETFMEQLGDDGLFISSERNIGLVAAINRGLASSDSDYSIIVQPQATVSSGWLAPLIDAASQGIGSPLIKGGSISEAKIPRHSFKIETRQISFATVALKTEMRLLIGDFDEGLDGGEWCLKDYVSRANSRGYQTFFTPASVVSSTPETVLGSPARRYEQSKQSRARYYERWGINKSYAIPYAGIDLLNHEDIIRVILEGARRGNRFTLFLQRKQAALFKRMGWDCLHSGIEIQRLSIFMSLRDQNKRLATLLTKSPDTVLLSTADRLTSFCAGRAD